MVERVAAGEEARAEMVAPVDVAGPAGRPDASGVDRVILLPGHGKGPSGFGAVVPVLSVHFLSAFVDAGIPCLPQGGMPTFTG